MIELYFWPTPNGWKVSIALEEFGLPYRTHLVDISAGDQHTDAFLAISPNGKMPAIVDPDGPDSAPIAIFESGAITEYLCEREGAFGRAPGEAERVDWLEWLHFGETIGQHLANLTQHHIALREPWMRSETVMRLEAKRLEKARTGATVDARA